jgi:hypothetical protein
MTVLHPIFVIVFLLSFFRSKLNKTNRLFPHPRAREASVTVTAIRFQGFNIESDALCADGTAAPSLVLDIHITKCGKLALYLVHCGPTTIFVCLQPERRSFTKVVTEGITNDLIDLGGVGKGYHSVTLYPLLGRYVLRNFEIQRRDLQSGDPCL